MSRWLMDSPVARIHKEGNWRMPHAARRGRLGVGAYSSSESHQPARHVSADDKTPANSSSAASCTVGHQPLSHELGIFAKADGLYTVGYGRPGLPRPHQAGTAEIGLRSCTGTGKARQTSALAVNAKGEVMMAWAEDRLAKGGALAWQVLHKKANQLTSAAASRRHPVWGCLRDCRAMDVLRCFIELAARSGSRLLRMVESCQFHVEPFAARSRSTLERRPSTLSATRGVSLSLHRLGHGSTLVFIRAGDQAARSCCRWPPEPAFPLHRLRLATGLGDGRHWPSYRHAIWLKDLIALLDHAGAGAAVRSAIRLARRCFASAASLAERFGAACAERFRAQTAGHPLEVLVSVPGPLWRGR